ncbi:MAG: murein hydrolase activator EnvC family protein [Lachnospiraceae bacterium]
MKKLYQILILAIFFLFFAFQPSGITVQATQSLDDSIEQKKEEIKKAEEEKKNLQQGLTNVKEMLENLESTKSNLENYVVKLDGQLTTVEQKINELFVMIEEKEQEIKKTTKELEEAEQLEKEQYEAMKTRIRFMYEKGDTFYLELLFSSTSFGEMLNKAEYIEALSAYDRTMLDAYQKNREYIEVCKEELELEEELLKDAKAAVEKEQANLSSLISAKEGEITKYEGDISTQAQAIKEYEEEIKAQNAVIAALEAERKRLEAENESKFDYDGGMFAWPAPSYTRISDDYGNRIHPILNVQQFHNGVDMAAPSGTPILSAYDGEVVAATYNATMGNYVMINHGGGLYTIYMHASALYTSEGAKVARGDKIAAVGTTGRSTGNHLHFSVRLNGSYVSPWNYLNKP